MEKVESTQAYTTTQQYPSQQVIYPNQQVIYPQQQVVYAPPQQVVYQQPMYTYQYPMQQQQQQQQVVYAPTTTTTQQQQVVYVQPQVVRQQVRGPALCAKCGTSYPLPQHATSWRCRNCHHYNDLAPGCCTIL